ncbi:hypothetical protein ACRALDRAFT_1075848 [Sodiomyces alcalophilus JCM 7366]|uniref:uncharacterized protein n=1 Tax=Sodiomyces alcalophilus JCM 7366 TaxID=591952 RepID=UPI0039B40B9C
MYNALCIGPRQERNGIRANRPTEHMPASKHLHGPPKVVARRLRPIDLAKMVKGGVKWDLTRSKC